MEQSLERGDLRLILACLAIAAVSLLVGTHLFYDAFPEATIDFAITRDEAADRGASFLEQRGFDLTGYRQAALFEFDDAAKTFLERELGLEGARGAIGDPVRLWRWSSRWFRELQKEEFRVQYTTTGDLVGFAHLVEEEAGGADLPQAAARALAEQFLGHSLRIDLSTLEFVEAESTRRPNRVDHAFTWKLAGFAVADDGAGHGGATYRYRVGIQGDLVGSYGEFLKVPEAWTRQYEQLRSRNEATGMAAALLLFLTWLAMLARLVASTRAQDVRWKAVAVFGAIAFALTFLSQLNALPVAVYGFDTTDSYNSFLTQRVLSGLALALLSGLGIAFVVAGAEPEYRRWYGNHLSIAEQFLPDGLRTRRFLIGTAIGLTMAAAFVAYQTVFYVVAERFGAWSPADIPYREMVNTHFPWVVVLLIGFMPAVSEEFTSRAFSIPFLHRVLGRRGVAVVLSALVWGFAHAGYPQQPFWIRGLEVGLAGIAVGWVVVRWGLLPALVWHYTIDALYTALILLRSSNPYFVLSAAVSVGLMLLPLAAAVLLYLRRRYFIDPVSLLNREDAPPLPAPPRAAVGRDLSPEAQILAWANLGPIYHPVRPSRLLLATGLVLAGLGAFLVPRPDAEAPVDFGATAGQARAAAHARLAASGVDVDRFRTAVAQRHNWDPDAATYRHERAGPAAAAAIYRADLAPALWRVRLFRPLEKEEWEVFLRPGGDLYTVDHHLAEDAPGADLDNLAARAVAEAALREAALDPQAFALKESSSEKLAARRDHWFTWEAAPGDGRNLDESTFRCEVHVAGDRAASLRRYVKLPEAWLRQRQEDTLWRTALRWVPVATAIGVSLHLLWLLVGRIRAGELDWRRPLWLGAAGAGLFLLGFANQLPTVLADYPTEIPLTLFTLMRAIGVAVVTLLVGLLVAGGTGLVSSVFPWALDRLRPQALVPQLRDAVLLGGLAVAGSLAARRLAELFASALPEAAPPLYPAVPAVDAFWPAVSGLTGALASAFLAPLAVALAVFYATRVVRRASLVVVALLVLGASVAGAEAYRVPTFFYELFGFALSVGVAAAAIAWLYRDNVAAYALTGFLVPSVHGGLLLAQQSALAYRIHGWLWLVAAALVGLALWTVAARAASAGDGDGH